MRKRGEIRSSGRPLFPTQGFYRSGVGGSRQSRTYLHQLRSYGTPPALVSARGSQEIAQLALYTRVD